MNIAADTIAIFQTYDFATVAFHFRGLRIQNNVDVFQAAQFVLQNLVGFHFWRKFQQRYVLNDTRQVNCRFHAGVTAADNRYAFAFKQRAVAVRAVGHAFGAILIFARNVHVAPFCTSRHDNAACFQYRARSCFNLMQAAFNRCRDQFARALAIDHINVVFINMNFQRTCQFLAFGLRYRNVVFDINGIEDLTTKTFAHQTGTDAFTCGVNCCRCTRRSGTND
ncbi:hypothetical protein HmCmsJML288_01033 [Escherichia coli]|nr:hypothetical protein HmCmsJML288_01033 [Escherichia coli]